MAKPQIYPTQKKPTTKGSSPEPKAKEKLDQVNVLKEDYEIIERMKNEKRRKTRKKVFQYDIIHDLLGKKGSKRKQPDEILDDNTGKDDPEAYDSTDGNRIIQS